MKAWMLAAALSLYAHAGAATAQQLEGDRGAYLSAAFGNGRIEGGNASGYTWMRGRAFEFRAGEQQRTLFGLPVPLPGSASLRTDFVYYNEGHPDNNHRDGFGPQWVFVQRFGERVTGEIGAGPYLSMNTTVIDGRQIDDAHVGVLASLALRLALPGSSGTHLRLAYHHVGMRDVHRSDALVLGIGRQYGHAEPAPDRNPDGHLWLGATFGSSITNMSGTHGAHAGVLEAREYGGRWGLGLKVLFEGDDGARVDRRGVAAQVWYTQPVTSGFSMSAGVGPYRAVNRRDANSIANYLAISFQAEKALTPRTRAILNFNRVKTFRKTDDRDLFMIGLLHHFG